MQTGKRIDLTMERKCLRWEGGSPYIDFRWGYACNGCLPVEYDSLKSMSRSSAQPTCRIILFLLWIV